MTPAVSVVVPTFNRSASLLRAIHALSANVVAGGFEVIVINDGSTDATAVMLSKVEVDFPLTVIHQENLGPSVARNVGIQQARGRLIVFVDDDCVATPTLLESHRRAHEQSPQRSVVLGPFPAERLTDLRAWTAWEQRRIERTFRSLAEGAQTPTWRNLFTGNASIGRDDLLRAGGFDPAFRRAEDIELGQRLSRLGLEFVFDPNARSTHHPERSLEAWHQGFVLYGQAEVRLMQAEGRPLASMFDSDEFGQRNVVIRMATALSAGSSRGRTLAERALMSIVKVGDRFRLNGVTEPALSILASIAYFNAMTDEINRPADHQIESVTQLSAS